MTQLQYVECKIGNKVYGKYQVVVPRDIVERAGWKAKEQVVFRAAGKGRIIATAHTPDQKTEKMTYVEFKDAVKVVLDSASEGLTWSEIRLRNSTLPLKPHALWVRQLEADIQLEREPKSGKSIWSIGNKTSNAE